MRVPLFSFSPIPYLKVSTSFKGFLSFAAGMTSGWPTAMMQDTSYSSGRSRISLIFSSSYRPMMSVPRSTARAARQK